MDREGLRALVQKLLELPVVWDHERMPIAPAQPVFAAATPFSPSLPYPATQPIAAGSKGQGLATVALHNETQTNVCTEQTYNSITDSIEYTVNSYYNATLSVHIECYGARDAMDFAANLMRRIHFPSVTATLKAMDAAIVYTLGSHRIFLQQDHLRTSGAGVDILISYAIAEKDGVTDDRMLDADLSGTLDGIDF